MLLKQMLFAFACTLTLVGCNSDIEDAVREKLKDPYSAKFEEIIRLGKRACVRYNAKNSYGAYSGTVTASLVELGHKHWYVETHGEEDEECTTYSLEKKLAVDAADRKSEDQVLALLKANKLASSDASDATLAATDLKEPCSSFVSKILSYARLANASTTDEEKAEWEAEFNSGMRQLEKGSCPTPGETDLAAAQAAAEAAALAADAAAMAADAAAAGSN